MFRSARCWSCCVRCIQSMTTSAIASHRRTVPIDCLATGKLSVAVGPRTSGNDPLVAPWELSLWWGQVRIDLTDVHAMRMWPSGTCPGADLCSRRTTTAPHAQISVSFGAGNGRVGVQLFHMLDEEERACRCSNPEFRLASRPGPDSGVPGTQAAYYVRWSKDLMCM
jgi:hypothetical protein